MQHVPGRDGCQPCGKHLQTRKAGARATPRPAAPAPAPLHCDYLTLKPALTTSSPSHTPPGSPHTQGSAACPSPTIAAHSTNEGNRPASEALPECSPPLTLLPPDEDTPSSNPMHLSTSEAKIMGRHTPWHCRGPFLASRAQPVSKGRMSARRVLSHSQQHFRSTRPTHHTTREGGPGPLPPCPALPCPALGLCHPLRWGPGSSSPSHFPSSARPSHCSGMSA
ncbi:translation initiation factor IF-2-like [Rhinolophus ferrumequinum]|uniref:translation initiation factor IF-2-like n=1 Tax=Rhinolophus ferrumequinum TaxID=59479 RepID=UPI00140F57B6|nr:translation initiation factor IF-2-like [Rhinolophus ferrumequinum]